MENERVSESESTTFCFASIDTKLLEEEDVVVEKQNGR